MATQGCMCGYRGDPLHECHCTPLQVQKYRNRISGPLRNRIDLVVEVPGVRFSVLTSGPAGESSATVHARVVKARTRQAARFSDTRLRVNADLHGRALRRHCPLASVAVLTGCLLGQAAGSTGQLPVLPPRLLGLDAFMAIPEAPIRRRRSPRFSGRSAERSARDGQPYDIFMTRPRRGSLEWLGPLFVTPPGLAH